MRDRLRILHDPLAYYRPWQAAGASLSMSQRSALNRWISLTHALPRAPADLGAGSALVDRLIRGWWRMPAAAWLLACAGHRRHVLGARWLTAQPPVLHAFLRLGFPEVSIRWSHPPPPDMLLAWGGQQLQHGLRSHVPDWLHARIGLWFEGLPELPEAAGGAVQPFDMTCFLSAWNHAADLS